MNGLSFDFGHNDSRYYNHFGGKSCILPPVKGQFNPTESENDQGRVLNQVRPSPLRGRKFVQHLYKVTSHSHSRYFV